MIYFYVQGLAVMSDLGTKFIVDYFSTKILAGISSPCLLFKENVLLSSLDIRKVAIVCKCDVFHEVFFLSI
jgi:hypothetical protein